MESHNADDDFTNLLSKLVPENHLAISLDANRTIKNAFKILFEKVNTLCYSLTIK